MIAALSAVELVAYQRFTDAVTLATIYQDVPENAAPPIVVIGDLGWKPLDAGKDDDVDCIVTLTVLSETIGHERQPCLDLLEEVEGSLRNVDDEQDGWRLKFRCLGSEAGLAEDAGSYIGTTTFEITALRV